MNLAELLASADAATKDIEINSGNTEFKPLPPGEYEAVVDEASGPHNSQRANPLNPSEFGKYIKIRFSIVGGEYNGRKVFITNNVIVSPKTTSDEDKRKALIAMAIGNNERKILIAAVGKNAIQTAEELIGAQCRLVLAIKKNINGKDDNEVKKILPSSGSSSTVAAPSAPVQTSVSAKKKMPWEK